MRARYCEQSYWLEIVDAEVLPGPDACVRIPLVLWRWILDTPLPVRGMIVGRHRAPSTLLVDTWDVRDTCVRIPAWIFASPVETSTVVTVDPRPEATELVSDVEARVRARVARTSDAHVWAAVCREICRTAAMLYVPERFDQNIAHLAERALILGMDVRCGSTAVQRVEADASGYFAVLDNPTYLEVPCTS